MSNVPVWFERTFEFRFPVDHYPNLCIRLRGTPARLEEIVRGVPRDVLDRKPGDKWSAQEHVGHLLDLEPLWAARVDDFVAGGDTLTAADLRNRKTDEANHNARDIAEILTGFRAARRRDAVRHLRPLDAAPEAEAADAARRSSVLRRGTRRSSSRHHLGVDWAA